MAEFASLHSYLEFQKSVRWRARYVHDEQTREFLRCVLETSAPRVKTLRKDQILFRAQRGFTWRTEHAGEDEEFDVETAFGPERMIPKGQFIGEGRVNPARIPCLYLATNRNTAMAEVRPWIGSRISLAEFRVMRECRIVDCSLDRKRSWEFEIIDLNTGAQTAETTASEKEAGVWGDIAHAFSEPVSADEPHSDYTPTQVLGEVFREHGCDGIMYKSLLDERGRNIALFDVTSAELINCCLFETKSISFEFSQTENPYFIPKHYPETLKAIERQG